MVSPEARSIYMQTKQESALRRLYIYIYMKNLIKKKVRAVTNAQDVLMVALRLWFVFKWF